MKKIVSVFSLIIFSFVVFGVQKKEIVVENDGYAKKCVRKDCLLLGGGMPRPKVNREGGVISSGKSESVDKPKVAKKKRKMEQKSRSEENSTKSK